MPLTIAMILLMSATLFALSGATPAPQLIIQTAASSITRCDVKAYVIDQDPHGMNVRSAPSNTAKVIGNLPTVKAEGVEVHITGSSGDWVRIDRAQEQGTDDGRILFKGAGWVYAPLLAVDGVGGIEGGTKIYGTPSTKSPILARMDAGGDGATLRGCQGKWTYIKYRKVLGWAAADTLCSNSLTTCS
jgi:SH3-like domain-containing protein